MPPIYTMFKSRTELVLWTIGISWVMGGVLFPILLAHPQLMDTMLMVAGGWCAGQIVFSLRDSYRLNKELRELTEESR